MFVLFRSLGSQLSPQHQVHMCESLSRSRTENIGKEIAACSRSQLRFDSKCLAAFGIPVLEITDKLHVIVFVLLPVLFCRS